MSTHIMIFTGKYIKDLADGLITDEDTARHEKEISKYLATCKEADRLNVIVEKGLILK